MKKIDISTKKHPNTFALVDDRDFDRISGAGKWYALNREGKIYAAITVKREDKRVMLLMHREVVAARAAEQVDHRDMNTLNNTRENLRICDKAKNMWNRGRTRLNTSGFKGVYFDKQTGRWRAEIQANGKRRKLGRFKTAEQAAAAYDKAALKYHGPFARTNAMATAEKQAA